MNKSRKEININFFFYLFLFSRLKIPALQLWILTSKPAKQLCMNP